MKKLLASALLALGLYAPLSAANSYVANMVLPETQEVNAVQKTSKPDRMMIVFDDKGVIIDIIVIKNK